MVQYIGTDPHEATRLQPPPINLYPHLRFEPYRFREFPQWVQKPGTDDEAHRVLVHDEEEKAHVLRGSAEPAPAREADEKTHLYAVAEQKGIMVDKRWGLDTLRLKVLGPAPMAEAG